MKPQTSIPSSYETVEGIAQEATMWHNTGEVSLYQEEMQKEDTKATCQCPNSTC